jgi:hypothetical protein
MAGRYLVTGAQLGLIKGLIKHEPNEVEKVIDEIIKSQYTGHSNKNVIDDCERLSTTDFFTGD